jgi:hypothetical protein
MTSNKDDSCRKTTGHAVGKQGVEFCYKSDTKGWVSARFDPFGFYTP